MFRFIPLFLLSALFTIPALAAQPRTVPLVDMEKYVGQWVEVARIPNAFQDDIERDGSGFSACRNVTASYGFLPKEKISVMNTCLRVNAAGEERTEVAKARARVIEGSRGAKLKVNFTGKRFLEWLGIGDGDYWILELGPVNRDGLYSYVLVGEPKREHAWILSRTKALPPEIVNSLVDHLRAEGFDTRNLVYTH